ncbi:MAG: LptF/LptG family permease [Deltaproteobacteria bacterium]|nr:LptF/LptG family permease [Deltaproteobacteria bacterium]
MRIPRLDRYLALEIVGPFAAALSFLFGLLLAMQLLRGIDVMLGSAVRPVDLARVLGYLAPHFLAMAMPVSYLFALLLAVGRWSEDREVTALAASGVAPWRLWVAPLGLALLISAAGIAMGRGPEPHGLAALRLHVNNLIKRNMAGDVKPGVFYDTLNAITLYSQGVSPKTRRFSNVLLADERDPDASLLVLARNGYVDPHGGGGTLRFVLGDGEIHRSAASAEDYAVLTFQHATLNIGVTDDLLRRNQFGRPREELTPGELGERAERAEREGQAAEARSLRVAEARRTAGPLATVAFALCGVPLAMRRRQGSRALGAVATLAAYVGYYVVARAAEVAAEQGRLPALLAAHLANLLFVAIGIALLRRAARVGG